jgi:hypothetical protein
MAKIGHYLKFDSFGCSVESRCGAVIVGASYLLPPLSSGGAQVPVP